MDSDEARRIVARGANGRISRRDVIARPAKPGFTFGPSIALTPIPTQAIWDFSSHPHGPS